MSEKTIRFLIAAAVLSWSSSALVQHLDPAMRQFVSVDEKVIVLSHVRVIDGTGAPARDDQTIVLRDGTIESIQNSADASIPAGIKVLDLTGRTVIPGIVGMHDHLFYPLSSDMYGTMTLTFPRLYLAAGVTTIRTAGAIEPYTELEIKHKIDVGDMVGPRIHVTGPYLGLGPATLQGHPLNGPDDAAKTVNFWMDQGADNFKAYQFITATELKAAIATAHKRGAKVTGHLCSVGFREAAALGIDNVEHGLIEDHEFFPWNKPGECPDNPESTAYMSKLDVQSGPVHDMILDLVQHHVALTSTLPIFEMWVPGRPAIQQRVLDVLSPDAKTFFFSIKLQQSDEHSIKAWYHSDHSPQPAAFKKEMEFEYAFVRAGGLLLAGEDPSWTGVVAGFGDQRELELLVEAGFSPVEAIRIATFNGAQYLGEVNRIGSIAVGKQADLVVIMGDPSRKIEDIENVEIVFKAGVGYDPAKLLASVRGQVGLH
jgi:imidazolonepropionase-like amidohydrolase